MSRQRCAWRRSGLGLLLPFTPAPRFSTDSASTGSPGGTPVSCCSSPAQKPAPPTADPPCVPAEKLCTSASARSAAVTTRFHGPGPLSVTHSSNPPPTPPSAVPGNSSGTQLIGCQSCDIGEKELRVTNRFCNTLCFC